MNIQASFRRFHELIQLRDLEENSELRGKRDNILARLRSELGRDYSFVPFNQGSYAMGTGVQPLNRDYDIDVGLVFNLAPDQIRPEVLKGRVHRALDGYTTQVEWRRPCITVYYRKQWETVYHVDLTVYTRGADGRLYLATGKEHADEKEWQLSDARGLIERISSLYTGEDAAQFQRVIRYLKRWKDHQFPTHGQAAPVGIGLTIAAFHWFRPTRQSAGGGYDDLAALLNLVRSMRQGFNGGRLVQKVPVEPYDDVLQRMTPQHMIEFEGRLEKLDTWLTEVREQNRIERLKQAFGDAYPLD